MQLLYFKRMTEFRVNPLEPIDLLTKVSRVYDEWVRACVASASDSEAYDGAALVANNSAVRVP